MAQHRLSARVTLSPLAEKKYLAACKVHGGATQFITDAIEFYAHFGLDIKEELVEIKQLLRDLKSGGALIAQDPAGEAADRSTDENSETKVMTDEQFASYSTLLNLLGGDDD